jgi:hypothetical protein
MGWAGKSSINCPSSSDSSPPFPKDDALLRCFLSLLREIITQAKRLQDNPSFLQQLQRMRRAKEVAIAFKELEQ